MFYLLCPIEPILRRQTLRRHPHGRSRVPPKNRRQLPTDADRFPTTKPLNANMRLRLDHHQFIHRQATRIWPNVKGDLESLPITGRSIRRRLISTRLRFNTIQTVWTRSMKWHGCARHATMPDFAMDIVRSFYHEGQLKSRLGPDNLIGIISAQRRRRTLNTGTLMQPCASKKKASHELPIPISRKPDSD